MDTQNVSAQLYFKQLPENNSMAALDPIKSDSQIETAFQQQLDLSEYYKSPQVFDVIKKQYMDQVMENQNVSTTTFKPTHPPPPAVPTQIPVGPTDFLRNFIKEGFGSTRSVLIILYIIGIIVGIGAYFIFK